MASTIDKTLNGDTTADGRQVSKFELEQQFGAAKTDIEALQAGTGLTNDVVTDAKLADMDANTLKANPTGVSADPQNLTLGASTIAARLETGNIKAATPAEIHTLLNIHASNKLINSDFRVWQQGTSFTAATTPSNNDNAWTADQWNLLSDGNDVADVDKESGSGVSATEEGIKLTTATASKKFGVFQPIEQEDIRDIVNGIVSLSVELEVSDATKLSDIRVGILEWTGTADSITGDPISAWGAEGSNPTLVANWAFSNTPANLSVTDLPVRYTIENVSISTGVTNVGVLIWQNNVATNDVTATELKFTRVKLNKGKVATPYVPLPVREEQANCLRHFDRQGDGSRSGSEVIGTTGLVINTSIMRIPFPINMRIEPALIISAASDFLIEESGGTTVTPTGLSVLAAQSSRRMVYLKIDDSLAGFTVGDVNVLRCFNANARLDFDARLI